MTPKQQQILQMLVDGEDMYWDEGPLVYIGNMRTNTAMIYGMIRRMWIKQDPLSPSYWVISYKGRRALSDALKGKLGTEDNKPNSYFKRFRAETSVEEIRMLSRMLHKFYEKYASIQMDGKVCAECGYMHRVVRLPRIKPTGGSSSLVRWDWD